MNLQVAVFESLELRVDTAAYRVERGGAPVSLEPKAFDLLVFLLANAGQLVTKQRLLDEVWGGTAVSDNALTRVIAQLRKAIGDDAREARYLETIPTRGYRWIAPVTRGQTGVGLGSDPGPTPLGARFDPGRSGVGAGSEVEYGTTQGVESPRRRNLRTAALASIAVAALVGAIWFFVSRQQSAPTPIVPRQLTTSAGVDLFPSLSPDGRRVAFSSDRTGRWEIYIRPTEGAAPEQTLTADGAQNVNAAWSPDGRTIAYHSIVNGGIWLISVDGGPPRRLTDFGARPAWSPDSRRIAFQSQAGADIGPAARPANLPSAIWIIDTRGGQPRPLTRSGVPMGGHGAPTWSPDGHHVAFATAGFAISQIWAIDERGGDPFPVATSAPAAVDPVYTPDGRAIVFGAARALWRVPLDTNGRPDGEAARFVLEGLDGLRHLSSSSNGRIALSALTLKTTLYAAPVDANGLLAGDPRPLTNDTRTRNSLPAFSPDGERIAVMSSMAGSLPDIWMMNKDGSGLTQVTDNSGFEANPAWSSDGRSIIFRSLRRHVVGLYTVSIDTRRERPLIEYGTVEDLVRQQGLVEESTISPDNTRIAYTVYDPRTNSKALFLRDLKSGAATRLTSGIPIVSYPAWSPDGQSIAVELLQEHGSDAAVVPITGAAPRQLTAVRGESWVHSWTPDSRRVVFAGQRDGVWNIYWVPAHGGPERRITNYTGVGTFVRYPAWSPQNDQVVYEYGDVRGNVWLVDLR